MINPADVCTKNTQHTTHTTHTTHTRCLRPGLQLLQVILQETLARLCLLSLHVPLCVTGHLLHVHARMVMSLVRLLHLSLFLLLLVLLPCLCAVHLTLNQGNILSLSAYEVSKKIVHLLRHSQQVHREEDGAVHFWRIKEHLQSQFPQIPHWSDDRWKACLAAGGGAKRRFQYCTDDSGTIVYFRALQGHSGRNLIDPSLQDNVVRPSNFFQYIYHIGCAFNLHSIINSGLTPGGQNSSKRQTEFFLPIDPGDISHKDPDEIDLNVPRHAQ